MTWIFEHRAIARFRVSAGIDNDSDALNTLRELAVQAKRIPNTYTRAEEKLFRVGRLIFVARVLNDYAFVRTVFDSAEAGLS